MIASAIKQFTAKIKKLRLMPNNQIKQDIPHLNLKNLTPPFLKVFKKVKKDKQIIQAGLFLPLVNLILSHFNTQQSITTMLKNIANFLLNAGHPSLAAKYYQLSLSHRLDSKTYSLFLQCLLMDPSCTEKNMHKAACQYEKLFLNSIIPISQHSNHLIQNRKLKIGYLCHFFHNSVSKSILLPFLKNHNRNRVNIFCYSDATPDEVTPEIKAAADHWRDTKALSDDELATLIQTDRIDILLELNGHCVVNRYGVIARKPAPIQINYYNLCATSGIKTIDYLLVGNSIDLSASKPYYTESIFSLRCPGGIAQFPDWFPPPAAVPPSVHKPYVTFGSFGGAHKVNAEVIKLWCKVLYAIPHSKFYMKASVLSFPEFENAFRALFAKNGINAERLILEGFSEHRAMLACYANIDIALDTFPGQGGTTTTEALWQGVPVISLKGSRYSMQVGPMILQAIHHPELIASSADEYIQKAIDLAADIDRLKTYRSTLRDDFKHSSLTDAVNFAANLEDAYEAMWYKYYLEKTQNHS